ncbi:transglutaminase-like cysteine peptidase [Brevundimonas sp. TWP2-3-4b1]|uniref:transglutaminase-like cysteine peptidase n=1 Tax=Brevundimonas sp. TWP2-3-4b1 TaxID=2804580 RepID=UPI003CE9CB88
MLDLPPSGRIALLAAIALTVCDSGVAHAQSARRDAAAPVMALGASTIPPLGFLDLCQRTPEACISADIDAVDLAALRTAAMGKYWADAFAQRRAAPAAVAESRVDWSRVFANARRERPLAVRPAVARASADATGPGSAEPVEPAITTLAIRSTEVADATTAVAASDAAGSAVETEAGAMVEFAASAAGEAVSAVESSVVVEVAETDPPVVPAFALDRAGWKLVNGVNRRINRAIRQTADSRLYGVEDFWTLPSAGRGDCEDFVLAKREALTAAGVPPEALSIAIVETRWGESHAVLLLATDRGEYVLDSLSPWVSRWDRVDYAWKERQRPGRPFDWVTAEI